MPILIKGIHRGLVLEVEHSVSKYSGRAFWRTTLDCRKCKVFNYSRAKPLYTPGEDVLIEIEHRTMMDFVYHHAVKVWRRSHE